MDGRMRLLLASNNVGKLAQLGQLLEGLPIDLVRPIDLGLDLEVDESGSTYSANASQKALAFARASGLVALADDSGLEIPALDNWPGLHSVRFAGPNTDTITRQSLILRRALALPATERRARFVSVIAIADQRRVLIEAVGVLDGRIVLPRGNRGFGYDPIFEPEGSDATLAELASTDANRISHRGVALRELRPFLQHLAHAPPGHSADSSKTKFSN